MLVLSGQTASDLYADVVGRVLRDGVRTAPRGLETVEVLGACLELYDPRARLVVVPGRVINPAFAAAEAAWILSGSDAPWIFTYNRRLMEFADDGRLRGAYGPRLRAWGGGVDQLARVRDVLARDRSSRQAVVQLFDPARDWQAARDVPCTIGYRFFVRDGQLHMHCSMRSQDVWLGLPYDLFTNTVIHELMAGWLNVEIGRYRHWVDSLHLYASDLADANRVSAPDQPRPRGASLQVAFEDLDTTLEAVREHRPAFVRDGWSELAAVMASYQSWRAGRRDEAERAADRIGGALGDALERWYAHLRNGGGRS